MIAKPVRMEVTVKIVVIRLKVADAAAAVPDALVVAPHAVAVN